VGHSRAKWPERPQLKQVWPKVAPAVGGVALAVVEVEPWVLPTGAGAGVGREPTTAADTGADATAAAEAGRWGRDGTPSGTLDGHYRTELSQPSSSLSPCGRGLHRPQ
jgi:hypothetical protein